MSLSTKLIKLISSDPQRMHILSIVRDLDLPDGYVAAGSIRNLVWDHLHASTTALTDIDIVYFDLSETHSLHADERSAKLNQAYPAYTWQVKNQAHMHIRNDDAPYKSTLDAMRYWPEQETAVAAALTHDGHINIISAFGLASLFEGKITHNTQRSEGIFKQRITSKNWLEQWPKLQIVMQ